MEVVEESVGEDVACEVQVLEAGEPQGEVVESREGGALLWIAEECDSEVLERFREERERLREGGGVRLIALEGERFESSEGGEEEAQLAAEHPDAGE